MGVIKEPFGSFTDPETGEKLPVYKFKISVKDGIEVQLLSYGAGICGIIAPDSKGKRADVVLGFDTLKGYEDNAYQGSTVGRVANRIKAGQFELEGQKYSLPRNNGNNCLHGGTYGWAKRVWQDYSTDDSVVFSLVSRDGDQGFPGTVMAQVRYSVKPPGRLQIEYTAQTSAPTPINMTNHAYFNLAGHDGGRSELLRHTCQVYADKYVPVTPDLIPTGELLDVKGTPFDLTSPVALEEALQKVGDDGFDHCYVLTDTKRDSLRLGATFIHPSSGRCLEVLTTEPGVQFYTGNFLPSPDAGGLSGREGTAYCRQGAFCCEAQNLPDAVNQKNFPDSIVRPGNLYKHTIVYNFTVV